MKQMEKLKIEERKRVVEIEDNDLEETDRDFESSIACKILTLKTINGDVFSVIMPRIWGIKGAVRVEKARKNTFICKFRRQRDKIRITKGGPWSYDDVIIKIDEPKANSYVEDLEFKLVSFWIHFHKLPRVCYCKKHAIPLGNSIGEFEAAESDGNDKMEGMSLRVKVKINVNELKGNERQNWIDGGENLDSDNLRKTPRFLLLLWQAWSRGVGLRRRRDE